MLRILVAIVMLVVIYCEASGVCPWSAPNIMCIRQGDRECEADDQVQYFLLYLGSGPEEGEVLKNTGGLSFVCLSVCLFVCSFLFCDKMGNNSKDIFKEMLQYDGSNNGSTMKAFYNRQ